MGTGEEIMDTEDLCSHPFDELLSEGGIWYCKCGANGILVADSTTQKLKYAIQPPIRDTRATRRRMMRQMMRNIKKMGKKQARLNSLNGRN